MVIIDYYVIGVIGATLSTLILFSMIKMNQKVNLNAGSKYYRYAIICGIISAASATIYLSIRILFCTDLIFPYNYAKNVNIATLLDHCKSSVLFWIYLSLFIIISKR